MAEERKGQEAKEQHDDGFKFIELMVEVESSDSILLVFSDGSVWSVFENVTCELIARPANQDKFKNLIGGQLV